MRFFARQAGHQDDSPVFQKFFRKFISIHFFKIAHLDIKNLSHKLYLYVSKIETY